MNTNESNGWRRSTFCETGGCVEVRAVADRVWIRDTRSGSFIAVTRGEFAALVAGARAGEFDDLTVPA